MKYKLHRFVIGNFFNFSYTSREREREKGSTVCSAIIATRVNVVVIAVVGYSISFHFPFMAFFPLHFLQYQKSFVPHSKHTRYVSMIHTSTSEQTSKTESTNHITAYPNTGRFCHPLHRCLFIATAFVFHIAHTHCNAG